jgi:peptidoglycan/xylan/chitin deacetylase (PgdA/CDA1 family)
MYHYVNEFAGSITVSPDCFEEHCRVLARHGWRGVGLDEAEDFLIRGKDLPKRSLLFTFDDGYLDNYVYALPSLHRYGHRGVVFAVSNRIEGRLEPEDAPRVSLEDALSGSAPALPEVSMPVKNTAEGFTRRRDVFLNRAEARSMDAHGALAVASHSRGHYLVCTGPEYNGFLRPGNLYRTFYHTEDALVWGSPAFTMGPGLLHRAFYPNPDLMDAIKALVPQDFAAAAAFFAKAEHLRELEALPGRFAGRLGRYEDDSERKERMWREIAGGKEELETVLGHGVRSLCWPWGAYCAGALALAREAGFELFFTTSEGVNPPGQPTVHRFKGKCKSGNWLLSRARIYASPLLGRLYAMMRL